jgi:hypothetical protein
VLFTLPQRAGDTCLHAEFGVLQRTFGQLQKVRPPREESTSVKMVGIPSGKIYSFLWPVKDDLALKTQAPASMGLTDSRRVEIRAKEHIRFYHPEKASFTRHDFSPGRRNYRPVISPDDVVHWLSVKPSHIPATMKPPFRHRVPPGSPLRGPAAGRRIPRAGSQ